MKRDVGKKIRAISFSNTHSQVHTLTGHHFNLKT